MNLFPLTNCPSGLVKSPRGFGLDAEIVIDRALQRPAGCQLNEVKPHAQGHSGGKKH